MSSEALPGPGFTNMKSVASAGRSNDPFVRALSRALRYETLLAFYCHRIPNPLADYDHAEAYLKVCARRDLQLPRFQSEYHGALYVGHSLKPSRNTVERLMKFPVALAPTSRSDKQRR